MTTDPTRILYWRTPDVLLCRSRCGRAILTRDNSVRDGRWSIELDGVHYGTSPLLKMAKEQAETRAQLAELGSM